MFESRLLETSRLVCVYVLQIASCSYNKIIGSIRSGPQKQKQLYNYVEILIKVLLSAIKLLFCNSLVTLCMLYRTITSCNLQVTLLLTSY